MRSEYWLATVLAMATVSAAAAAQERIRPDEAMALCCPDTAVRAHTVVLDANQRKNVAAASGEKAPGALVHTWEAHRDGKLVAVGYLDAHVVRTKKQILLVVVDAVGDKAGHVRRIEVLAFAEPRRYRPPGAFYDQFRGQQLGADLREGRSIRRVSGATMTTRATTAAVRRVLAVHAEVAAAVPK